MAESKGIPFECQDEGNGTEETKTVNPFGVIAEALAEISWLVDEMMTKYLELLLLNSEMGPLPLAPRLSSCCINPPGGQYRVSWSIRRMFRAVYIYGGPVEEESEVEPAYYLLPCPGCLEPRVPPLPDEYFDFCPIHQEDWRRLQDGPFEGQSCENVSCMNESRHYFGKRR